MIPVRPPHRLTAVQAPLLALALLLSASCPAPAAGAATVPAAPRHGPPADHSRMPPAPVPLKPAPDGSRFLFIMDMSSSMKATDPANRQALFDLIFTGFEGQMRHGDSFGLWLFSDEVRAGEFPLQIWDEQRPLEVASRATQFVRSQKYSGKPRLDEVVAKMLQVARSVKDVHLVLISTGEQPLRGTPLDASINEAYTRRQPERRKLGQPLLTTLNVRHGEMVSATVTLAGEYIELPTRPVPPPAAASTPAPVASAPTPAPRRIVPTPAAPAPKAIELPRPTTTRSEPTEPPTRTWTPAPPATTPAAIPKTDPITAAAVASPKPAAPSAPPAPVAQTPSPARTNETVVTTAALRTPATTPPAAPAPEPAPTLTASPAPKPVQVPAPTQIAQISQATPPTPTTPALSAPVPVAPPAKASTTLATTPPPTPTNPEPTTQSAPPIASFLPEPVPVQAREGIPADPSPATTSALPATVLVVQPGWGPTILMSIGAALLGACVILLALVLRRPPPQSQGSVITQSMRRQ